MKINLTLPEALAVLDQYAPASMSMRPGDREMLAEAQRVVSERASSIRERFHTTAEKPRFDLKTQVEAFGADSLLPDWKP